jgi:hypothetical protein
MSAGFITKLLQAAPELAGSAQRSVMKLLHALAHDDDTVTAFPRQQCAAYLMQIVEGAATGTTPNSEAAGGSAAGYSTLSGAGQAGHRGSLSAGSSRSELLLGADGSAALDVVAAVKALDVLVAVSRVDPQLLAGVKEYPGGAYKSAYCGVSYMYAVLWQGSAVSSCSLAVNNSIELPSCSNVFDQMRLDNASSMLAIPNQAQSNCRCLICCWFVLCLLQVASGCW